jgi:hypothetical protein
MALADTSRAIGAVSRALKARIDAISGVSTSIGRPSDVSAVGSSLNLFLYEVHFDEHLKNTPLNDGEKAPLWLVLRYLLTAFQSNEDSDSESAHDLLGAALRSVYTDDLLRLDGLAAVDLAALSPNPSPLHVSFEPAPADVAAKLMQGPDDKIRLSACFQVRPVMIAAAEPGDYSLLVGIDYTQTPTATVVEIPLVAPVGIEVIPSMGSIVERIEPSGFEIGEEISIFGSDLHLSGLTVQLGPIELPATMQQPDELRFRIDPDIIAASDISAGSHAVAIVQNLAGGKKRKSNAVIGNLVPSLRTATVVGAVVVVGGQVSATIELTGDLLGSPEDDVVIALYRDGSVTNMFDEFTEVPAAPRQTVRRFVIPPAPPPPDPEKKAVDAGTYNFILIVNGQQSPTSPRLELS